MPDPGRIATGTPTESSKHSVLITGAAGKIGSVLRHALLPHCRLLRSSDIVGIQPLTRQEESWPLDVQNLADTKQAMKGIDTVFHFGGLSMEDTWDAIRDVNINGTYNVYEAARCAGVRRIVFASSNHVVGFRQRDQVTGPDVPMRPDSRYGVSKVFGEAIGLLFADKYGIETISLRIGQFRPRPTNKRMLSLWLSERDMADLAVRCLFATDIRYEIVYGVSGNDRSWYSNPGAGRIGFFPKDNAETYFPTLSPEDMQENHIEARFQGGPFCLDEMVANGERQRG
ncbi:NAD(P)-dependent oxidoreductase [Agrobacterium rhizogenes]|uniref:NAD-dependent epimerase/dehydratase family protein n=1 Tax=Rhizobium rhizogenes TaxID=359 RepID=UPI0022B74D09|nr:NAD(P)-dependent oxidoreductase [Rhizobium rhizogenes]MCZ7447260.1 NAD(P)-dependent oxidoreductase [Rhizobium rhizogenes]